MRISTILIRVNDYISIGIVGVLTQRNKDYIRADFGILVGPNHCVRETLICEAVTLSACVDGGSRTRTDFPPIRVDLRLSMVTLVADSTRKTRSRLVLVLGFERDE